MISYTGCPANNRNKLQERGGLAEGYFPTINPDCHVVLLGMDRASNWPDIRSMVPSALPDIKQITVPDSSVKSGLGDMCFG